MSTTAASNDIQTRPQRREVLAQLAGPLRRFLATEAGSAGLLLGATVLALLWANSPWSHLYQALWHTPIAVAVGPYELRMDLSHWINDGLMALFFFIVGLEVRRELSVGELTDRQQLILPAIGAIGGLVMPAAIYLLINPSGEAARGWGVVIGTDTAFMLGALALVGPALATQLRVFLLSLTIADDVLAVSVIGLIYSESLHAIPMAVAGASLVAIAALGRFGIWQGLPYALVGAVLWVATLLSGLHPTIAGMAAGLLIGAQPPRRELVERAASLFRAFRQSPLPSVGYSAQTGLARAVSVNERLQESLHPWTSYVVVPIFALANAGVDLRGGLLGESLASPITWGIIIGLVFGKLVGIGLPSLIAARMGIGSIPQGVGPGQILGGSALSGIGFTVSLLIANLAFDTPALRQQSTVGVLLAALFSAIMGWLVFRLAAILLGERTASLPMALSRPVDPARDHVRGAVDAPLTLIEYGDFECPFCGNVTGVIRELRARFGDQLRYVFRHLPLMDVHPHAELAAQAAEAAGAQGRFWEMHDILFTHQDQLELEDLIGYAGNLDLDLERFTRDLGDGRYAARVQEHAASAEASGARGTPTFFIHDTRHVGPYDAATLAATLEAAHSADRTTA